MPGQIKRKIETIVKERSRGNPTVANLTKTKLILKGIEPDKFTINSPDDPETIQRLRAIASEMNVKV
jgi:hypothetical protein